MNTVTEQYIEQSKAEGSALRTAVADADLPATYRACWGAGLMSRPFFAAEDELMAFAADLMVFFDLLAELPARLFGGDVLRYCDVLGIDPRTAELLRSFANGPPTRYGRADLYHDGESFKLLEFNVASDLGGIDHSELQRGLLAVEAFRRFADEYRLDYVHGGEQIVRSLRAAAPNTDPVVAMVCADGDLARYRYLLDSTADMMRRLGLHVVLGELSGVRYRGGRLFLGDTRIDVVMRYFTVDHMVANEEFFAPVVRAHEAGVATLWTTMDSSLYSNKGALSLLSDPRWREVLSGPERELVDRVLPWTRFLDPGLVEQSVEEREQLIIKPPREFGGTGIVAGWETSEKVWRATLDECLHKHYVVQRRVVPAPEPVVDLVTGTVNDWVATWGVLLTPEGYSGTDVRALPAGAGAVVNYGRNAAARVSGVFTYAGGGAVVSPGTASGGRSG